MKYKTIALPCNVHTCNKSIVLQRPLMWYCIYLDNKAALRNINYILLKLVLKYFCGLSTIFAHFISLSALKQNYITLLLDIFFKISNKILNMAISDYNYLEGIILHKRI